MAGYDMHTHSVHSDGTTTIAENVAAAAQLGLSGIAVTDHDTTAPFAEAAVLARTCNIDVVPGTEFSAEYHGISVHVLGYWIDPDDVPLTTELARLRDERTDRARRMVGKLRHLGVDIQFARVVELAGEAPIGRPHIANAVVEAGGAPDMRTVFDRFLADGGPAYVEKHAVHPVRAVELLQAAGGVAVLAHPGLYGDRTSGDGVPEGLVRAMAEAGLAGIEAEHPDHDAATRERYRRLATALKIEVTGGSDFHGSAQPHALGTSTTPDDVVERLRARRA